MTAVPLLLFGAAAKRLPVVTMGLLQYITPIMQLVWAVLVRDEALSATTWVGFGLVWGALLLFTVDVLRRRSVALNSTGGTMTVAPDRDTEWL
jgi:chloramphenicol-sensitive protein RarD